MVVALEADISTMQESSVGSKYRRYKIQTLKAPHRYQIPHPFIPKVDKKGLAKILVSELFEYHFKLVKSDYREIFFSRPCIYGVFSGPLGGFSPIQERCVGCMRCVQEYPEVCRVDRNPEYTHLADSYWMPHDPTKVSDSPFGVVWYEAETGKIPVRGMGYKGLFAGQGWDSMWTDMSEIVRPTRDGVYGREFISTQVDVGSKAQQLTFPLERNTNRVFSLPIPMIFDHLPEKINSPDILKSIINAAKTVKTAAIVSPSLLEKYDITLHEDIKSVIPLISPDEVSKYSGMISESPAVELIVEDGLDISQLRSIDHTIPIIARLPLDQRVISRIDELFEKGVDGFHLVADYHGVEFGGSRFIKDLIQDVHSHLIDRGIRDNISLTFSGGIILAEHIPKAVIMGADVIALNTSALIALQVKFSTECRFSDQSVVYNTSFDSNWGQQRLVNLLGSWHNQLIEIMSAMGIKEIRRMRGDTGRAMTFDELEAEAFGDIDRVEGDE